MLVFCGFHFLSFFLIYFMILGFYTTIFVCSGLAVSQQGRVTASPDQQLCFGLYHIPFLAPVGSKTSPSLPPRHP